MKDMLKKFNTTETWIDVETLANLKGISKRAIRLSFNSKNSNYETKIENGKGGHLYKIRLSSIEEDLQIKYIHEYYDTLSTTNNIIELHNFEPKAEKIISFKQRELALAKYDLVKIWENYRLEQKQKGISKKVADSEFLTTYNTGLLYSKIFNVLGSISIGALYRWKMLLDKNPDWTVLVGNYNYTANGCYRTSLSKFEELGFTGVYQKLGITPVYATPYNARAKVIERFFLDFQESFEKLMPSYIGTSIDNKPAYMNRNEKLHKQIHSQKANFIPTIEQALILIKEWLKFKHSQPCPNNRNKQCHHCGKPNEFEHISGNKKFNKKVRFCHSYDCENLNKTDGSNPLEHENCCFGKYAQAKKKLYQQMKATKVTKEEKIKKFIEYCENKLKECHNIKWTVQTDKTPAKNEIEWFD